MKNKVNILPEDGQVKLTEEDKARNKYHCTNCEYRFEKRYRPGKPIAIQCPKCNETITTASFVVDPSCNAIEKGQSKLTKFFSAKKVEAVKIKGSQLEIERENRSFQPYIAAYISKK